MLDVAVFFLWVVSIIVLPAALVLAVAGGAWWLTRGWADPDAKRYRSYVLSALFTGFLLGMLFERTLPRFVALTHYLAELIAG